MSGRPESFLPFFNPDGSFEKGAWHVGTPGTIAGQKFDNINRATIGIELENAGRLKPNKGKYYTWPYYKKNTKIVDPALEISADRATKFPGDGIFDSFTEAQISSATQIVEVLEKTYLLGEDNFRYGHVDFDPERKEDPGPLWKHIHLPTVLTNTFV